MNALLRESLDRTLLLVRDDVGDEARDEDLLAALTGTRVVLAADARNLATPAAQTAFVTAALLMARCGHAVCLDAPDVLLAAPQPPLSGTHLVSSLLEVGRDLLPGIKFSLAPAGPVDLCVTLGDTVTAVEARLSFSMNAKAWAGWIEPTTCATRWHEPAWPMGAMAAGALAAAEAFKLAMQKLAGFARRPGYFRKLFASNTQVRFELAPPDTPMIADLGRLDFVSGGAITHASIYCILRLPHVRGGVRIIENTSSDHSNLNRYMLQRRSQLFEPKAHTLQRHSSDALRIMTATVRLEASTYASLMPLAPRVLVGVDHIPTRWFVQESDPAWLSIGASTHWNAMASFHAEHLACARCAHPRDDDNDAPIPTVAFVSFWAGLLQVVYLLRDLAKMPSDLDDQHVFFTAMRPEAPWRGPLIAQPDCPSCRKSRAA